MPASLAGKLDAELHFALSPEQTKWHDRSLQPGSFAVGLTGNVGTVFDD